MSRVVVFLLFLGAVLPAGVRAGEPGPRPETLGFDPARVQPPDAAKGEPLARVFYDYVYPSDLGAMSTELTEEQAQQLGDGIFAYLRHRCIEFNHITATPEEIKQFVDAIRDPSSGEEPDSTGSTENSEGSWETIAEQYIRGWKCDRTLYEEYGGVVIFQQGNPFEPVGAYRRFLEELEAAKVFEVYQAKNRDVFWSYFIRDHPFPVPPQEVNFKTPWWLQKQ